MLHHVRLTIFLSLFAFSGYSQNWRLLLDRADSLQQLGEYPAGILVAKQALNQAELEFSKKHLNYALTLGRLGSLQLDKGDYTNAEVNLIGSRDVFKDINITRDTNYVEILYSLGILYRAQNKFEVAITVLFEALNLTEQTVGKETSLYNVILGSLGNVYLVSGDYTKAELVFLKVLELKAKVSGKYNDDYASTLNSLGMLYSYKEVYYRAEEYLQEGLLIREKVLGPNHPSVGYMLNNLGFVYMNQGDYEAALNKYNRVIAINEIKSAGSQLYIAAVNNAAEAYQSMGQFKNADSLYEKLQSIIAKNLGTDHPNYAILLNNRGLLQQYLLHYPESKQFSEQAYAIYTAKMGENQVVSTSILDNLANAYAKLNKRRVADSLFRKALIITEKILGKNSLQYATHLKNYSQLLLDNNQLDDAVLLLGKAQNIIDSSLTKNFLYQTTRQQENQLAKWSPVMRSIFDLAIRNPKRTGLTKHAYDASLFVKGLLLSQKINLLSDARQISDRRIYTLIDSLRRVNSQLSMQYALPITQRKNLDSLETRAETLEKDLARQSATYRLTQQSLKIRWEDIRDALKPNEAAVEFVSFPKADGHQQTDSIRYLALVLRPGDKAPQVVPLLTDEGALRHLLARRRGRAGGAGLYATRGSEIDIDQLSRGDSLYQLIWQPIDQLLNNIKTVYLSPSGLLHQVSFAALPYRSKYPKNTYFLADRYQLRQVGSTRQVVTQKRDDESYRNIRSARLYGGIQYDLEGAAPGSWGFLPGTQREVEQIGKFVGSKAEVISGQNATETSLKILSSQSPTVLHFATHGFAFSDPAVSPNDSSIDASGTIFRRIANPLLRTGLLMAGANRVWRGGKSALGEDDGILTAYEVANLNLSATKLVVMSACETAIGDIRGSEGVFGLQRAFKLAGVDYLLMSLWPVSDQATSDLMVKFYKNWKKYQSLRTAFYRTQFQMRQKYPTSVWAAFILIN